MELLGFILSSLFCLLVQRQSESSKCPPVKEREKGKVDRRREKKTEKPHSRDQELNPRSLSPVLSALTNRHRQLKLNHDLKIMFDLHYNRWIKHLQ